MSLQSKKLQFKHCSYYAQQFIYANRVDYTAWPNKNSSRLYLGNSLGYSIDKNYLSNYENRLEIISRSTTA